MCIKFSREDGNRTGPLLGRGLEVLCVQLFCCWKMLNHRAHRFPLGNLSYRLPLANPFSNKAVRSWIEFLVRERDRTSAAFSGNRSSLYK